MPSKGIIEVLNLSFKALKRDREMRVAKRSLAPIGA